MISSCTIRHVPRVMAAVDPTCMAARPITHYDKLLVMTLAPRFLALLFMIMAVVLACVWVAQDKRHRVAWVRMKLTQSLLGAYTGSVCIA